MPEHLGQSATSDSGQKVIAALGTDELSERDLFIRLRPMDRLALRRVLRDLVRDGLVRERTEGHFPGPSYPVYRSALADLGQSETSRNEPLSAYVRRTRGDCEGAGPDWLADEIQVLEDALNHARARAGDFREPHHRRREGGVARRDG